jgi:hypothetical protein
MQNGDAYANLQEPAGPGVPAGVSRPAAAVVPIEEYRRQRTLERLASPEELREAGVTAAMAEYREWSAAGRPGAVTHAEAKRLLLGESG